MIIELFKKKFLMEYFVFNKISFFHDPTIESMI